MEAEKVRKAPGEPVRGPEEFERSPHAVDAEVAAEKALPLVAGRSRCPFCHAPVALDTQEWVACEGCLARHHSTCWRDNGACSSCGGGRSLVPGAKASAAKPATSKALWAACVALLGGVVYLGLQIDRLERQYFNQQATISAYAMQQVTELKAVRATVAKSQDELAAKVDAATESGKQAHDRADVQQQELARRTAVLELRGGELIELAIRLGAVEKRATFLEDDHRRIEKEERENVERHSSAAATAFSESVQNLESALARNTQGRATPEDLRIVASQAAARLNEAAKSFELARRPEDVRRVQAAAEVLANWKDLAESFRKALEILAGKVRDHGS